MSVTTALTVVCPGTTSVDRAGPKTLAPQISTSTPRRGNLPVTPSPCNPCRVAGTRRRPGQTSRTSRASSQWSPASWSSGPAHRRRQPLLRKRLISLAERMVRRQCCYFTVRTGGKRSPKMTACSEPGGAPPHPHPHQQCERPLLATHRFSLIL